MQSRYAALTLVEMIVVISLLAILLAILVPMVGDVMQVSRRVACRGNLHQAGVGLRIYLDNNKDIMPVATAMPSLHLNNEPRIYDVLSKYLSDPQVLLCPSDVNEKFFKSEGSSYAYNTMLGGRKVKDAFLTRRFDEGQIPVMHDYEPFHGRAGRAGAMNYLFADMSVGDLADK